MTREELITAFQSYINYRSVSGGCATCQFSVPVVDSPPWVCRLFADVKLVWKDLSFPTGEDATCDRYSLRSGAVPAPLVEFSVKPIVLPVLSALRIYLHFRRVKDSCFVCAHGRTDGAATTCVLSAQGVNLSFLTGGGTSICDAFQRKEKEIRSNVGVAGVLK